MVFFRRLAIRLFQPLLEALLMAMFDEIMAKLGEIQTSVANIGADVDALLAAQAGVLTADQAAAIKAKVDEVAAQAAQVDGKYPPA